MSLSEEQDRTLNTIIGIAEIPTKELVRSYVYAGLISEDANLMELLNEKNISDMTANYDVTSAPGDSWNLSLGVVDANDTPNLQPIIDINSETATQFCNVFVHSAKQFLQMFCARSGHPGLVGRNVCVDTTFTNIYLQGFDDHPVRLGIVVVKK